MDTGDRWHPEPPVQGVTCDTRLSTYLRPTKALIRYPLRYVVGTPTYDPLRSPEGPQSDPGGLSKTRTIPIRPRPTLRSGRLWS